MSALPTGYLRSRRVQWLCHRRPSIPLCAAPVESPIDCFSWQAALWQIDVSPPPPPRYTECTVDGTLLGGAQIATAVSHVRIIGVHDGDVWPLDQNGLAQFRLKVWFEPTASAHTKVDLSSLRSALSLCAVVTRHGGERLYGATAERNVTRACAAVGSEPPAWTIELPPGLSTLSFWAVGDDGSSKQVHVRHNSSASCTSPAAHNEHCHTASARTFDVGASAAERRPRCTC